MISLKEIGKVVVIDAETSGINYNSSNVANNYQAISWGVIISDLDNFKIHDKKYWEIKYESDNYYWDNKTEDIHGLTKKYLSENGVIQEQFVEEFIILLEEHFDLSQPIYLMGHHVVNFEINFLKNIFRRYELPMPNFRCIDITPVNMLLGLRSQDLIYKYAFGEQRVEANAIKDALACISIFKKLKKSIEEK